jgi:clan AA aspartic protease
MITGAVKGREARIQLRISGPRRRVQEIEAVIDTGFTGWLALPSAMASRLGLRWQTTVRGTLADGSERLFDVYEAKVVWGRRTRRVAVNAADTTPLVGMALLNGYELKIQVRARGKVTIKRLQ